MAYGTNVIKQNQSKLMGPGEPTALISATFCFPLSAARVEPAGGEGGGSGKKKVVDVWWK